MAVIRFTTVDRGLLPSWLSAGATFYLANQFQGFPLGLVAKRETEETHDGTPESYLHALQEQYTITTDIVPIQERDQWRAFFSSVLNAESFAIDFTAQQLVGNPGFETGALSPWLTGSGGTRAVNAASAIVGAYGLELTIAVNATGQLTESASAPTTASADHVFQVLARRSETSVPNRNLVLYSRFLDAANSSLAATTILGAAAGTSGVQLLAGVHTSPTSTANVRLGLQKASPHGTDEAGIWRVDQALVARLSTWKNVWLVENSIDEQQVGGVAVQYRFRVKTRP